MPRPGSGLLALVVLAAAPAVAAPGLPTASSRNVTATLVPETAALAPGQRLAVGLHLRMAEGWHTYWRNPGDSGMPTRIRWTLPEGFTAGDIQWPRPERMPTGPLMSYGYGGEVLMISDLVVPATLAAREVTLAARVTWLECREACLPGRADLSITLPVASGGGPPRPDWAAAFARARAQVPRPDPRLKAEASAAGDTLVLAVSGVGAPRHAYFYAALPQVVDHAAPQELAPAGGAFRLRLRRADNAAAPARLLGVLEADDRAWTIDAPVVRGSAARESPSLIFTEVLP